MVPTQAEKPVALSRLTAPVTQIGSTVVMLLAGCLWINNSIHSLEMKIVEDKAASVEAKAAADRAVNDRLAELQNRIADLQRQFGGYESRATNAVSRMELRVLFELLDAQNKDKGITVPKVQ